MVSRVEVSLMFGYHLGRVILLYALDAQTLSPPVVLRLHVVYEFLFPYMVLGNPDSLSWLVKLSQNQDGIFLHSVRTTDKHNYQVNNWNELSKIKQQK